MLDGDEPARRAAPELTARLARQFFVRMVGLPDGTQPDTVSPELLKEIIVSLAYQRV